MSDLDDYRSGTTWSGFTSPTLPVVEQPESSSAQSVNSGQGGSILEQPTPTGNQRGLALGEEEIVYTTYAGTDIVAQIIVPGEGPLTLGELETFSYSVHREKTPVRLLGSVAPAGFVAGPRTVAGTMIFLMFNNYVFYRLRQLSMGVRNGIYPLGDMLPPFDMVLTFANENGVFSKMKIFGMNIIDEGGTMSIEDLVSEQTMNYIARGIQPMTGFYLPRSG